MRPWHLAPGAREGAEVLLKNGSELTSNDIKEAEYFLLSEAAGTGLASLPRTVKWHYLLLWGHNM